VHHIADIGFIDPLAKSYCGYYDQSFIPDKRLLIEVAFFITQSGVVGQSSKTIHLQFLADGGILNQAELDKRLLDKYFPDRDAGSIFNLIEIDCIDRSVSYFQNENYIIRQSHRWRKLGVSSWEDILHYIP